MTTPSNWVQDTHALINTHPEQEHRPTRRLALQSAVGIGYAAAALPLMAQTAIKTPRDGLIEGEITIDVHGFKMPAYRAAPVGKTDLPVILVISEIFGVHEYIADVARRYAHLGYLAIAPELFVRQGDPSSYGEIAKLQAELISKVPDTQVMNDLDATLAWAGQHGGNPDRAAVTGFCWGGRITWLYSAHNPRIKAGVAWYGRLEGAISENNPHHPIQRVAALKAPVLGLYGGADTGIPLASVERMKDALSQVAATGQSAARSSRFVVYPDAPHAFHADYRPSYRPTAAADSWQQAVDWIRRHV